jgi:hypothetical protein
MVSSYAQAAAGKSDSKVDDFIASLSSSVKHLAQASAKKLPVQVVVKPVARVMGNQKWKRDKLTHEDLSDFMRELLLIATGKVWFCTRPLTDLNQGITNGKTIREIKDMLEEGYCWDRIRTLNLETVEKAFIGHHTRDIVNYDYRYQQLLLNRIAFHLCHRLGMDLTGYLLRTNSPDMVDSVFDRWLSELDGSPLPLRGEGMDPGSLDVADFNSWGDFLELDYVPWIIPPVFVQADPFDVLFNFDGDLLFSAFLPVVLQFGGVDQGDREIQVKRRPSEFEEDRDFSVEISHSGLLQLALDDMKKMGFKSPPQFRGFVPLFFHVRMAGRKFPIDEANTGETRVKIVYLDSFGNGR